MRRRACSIGRLLAAATVLAVIGCDDGGSRAAPVGVDIHGQWGGVYYVEGGSRVSITASVSQDGDAIVIKTDKAEPPGQSLTGTIDENGDIVLTDAYDAEVWTDYGTVTTTRLRVSDYERSPYIGEDPGDVPRKVIDLSR